MNNIHFSSKDQTWETPQHLFDNLNAEFNFTLDVAAADNTAKCANYYTIEDDALSKDWKGEVCWMNPPYGREIKFWIKKAYEESKEGAKVVALIPYRPDTRYWFDYIWLPITVDNLIYATETRPNVEVRALKGRLKFGGAPNSAPFPSAIIIFG